MTEKSFHHEPHDPGCKKIVVHCETEQRALITLLLILGWIIIPIIVFILFWKFWPGDDCWLCDEDNVKTQIALCAEQGSVHEHIRGLGPKNESREWLRGAGKHPDGLCKDIKKIIHQSIDYCEDCKKDIIVKTEKSRHPLARGQGVEMELSHNPICAGDPTDLTIRVLAPPDTSPKTSPPPVRVYRNNDLDIPTFCNNRGDGIWSLLDTPRVNYTRTTALVPNVNAGNVVDANEPGTSAPYVVFVARQNRSTKNVNVFFVYIDAVTYQPAMIEIAFEVLDGAAQFVDADGRLQLLSNIRLNSIEKTITFNIGRGARRLSIGGIDFGPVATDATPRSQHDASGSYIVDLSDNGAVIDVRRRS